MNAHKEKNISRKIELKINIIQLNNESNINKLYEHYSTIIKLNKYLICIIKLQTNVLYTTIAWLVQHA